MNSLKEKMVLPQIEELNRKLVALEGIHKANQPLSSQLQLLKTNLQSSHKFLASNSHQVAFVGSVGVGKTTAICGILGLLDKKGNTLLSAASGRTTLCEVEIKAGRANRILITPCSRNELHGYLRDFVEVLKMRNDGTSKNENDNIDLSPEVERCLRNMINLPRRHIKNQENEKKDAPHRTVDEAMELYKKTHNPDQFYKEIKSRLNADSRDLTEIKCPDDDFSEWLKRNFSDINQGKNPQTPMPQKIVIELNQPLFDNHDLDIHLVDTKGLDGNVEREDLDQKFQDARTVCVACTGFNDAPEQAVVDLLKHLSECGLQQQITSQTLLMVLDRNEEANEVLAEEGQVSSSEEGRSVRHGQIEDAFRNRLKMSNHHFPGIFFFNAKKDDSQKASSRVLEMITGLRRRHVEAVQEVGRAIDEIEKNREKAEAQAAFKNVSRAIQAWAQISRKQLAEVHQVYKSLVYDLENKEVYASSIRASVNREGSWFNFDFYYKLAVASRKKVVRAFGESVSEIKLVLSNFERQPEMKATHPFIRQVLHSVETNMEKIYEQASIKGRNVFESQLKKDDKFWVERKKDWGQGPGYKSRIAFGTDAWFKHNWSAKAEQELQVKVMHDWNKFIDLIESLTTKEKTVIT
jgi:hypothetical protein